MANDAEIKENTVLRQGVKAVASTAAGASLGVVCGIAAITAVGLAEILLPVGLCLWATGLTGGAVGLLLGTKSAKGGSASGTK